MENSNNKVTQLTSDLYFLIQRFLSAGPLRKTLEVLNQELEENKILPKRIDWLGNEHERTVDDMVEQFRHIQPDHLLYLCCQAASSNVNNKNLSSLLSFRPNKYNENNVLYNCVQIFNYVTRSHGVPIQNLHDSFNIANSIRGRELSGPFSRKRSISSKLYSSIQIQRTTLGHLSAVYCLLFDHTGKFIITGADDLLIKLWSTYTGRLIAAFRGASSEITDIAINPENTLLAAGSIDRILRVWNLQTGFPVSVLTGHSGMITSVNFCPTPCWGVRYLISTSTDGNVAFWSYDYDAYGVTDFRSTPIMYQEKIRPGQAQMICSSFSPGGTFVATGSADHHVRVYYMMGDEGPQRILETEAHTDRVDSIQWAHSGLRFLSGSKDGTAIIWWFERQQWKNILLDMTTKLSTETNSPESEVKKLKVTMVAWNTSDTFVVTAVSDYTLKVWLPSNGKLVKVLAGHKDEAYVLEAHPLDDNVMLSAGHDGQLFIWDIHKGEIVYRFLNTIEGQGYGALFDVKWSPDGSIIAASDSHGNILTFGFGNGSPFYEQLPKELFFHTDYRPLVRDQAHRVLDEQTHLPPHLMPPPFLVDIDGNPYPPMLQRLVPGRENCNVEQLVPNIIIGNEGTQEVIQISDIPHRLSTEDDEDNIRNNATSTLRTIRRPRDSERIRQSTGDWQSDPNIQWKKQCLVKPLKPAILEKSKEIRKYTKEAELEEYQRQLRQRPHMICTSTSKTSANTSRNADKKKKAAKYTTRSTKTYAYKDDHEEEEQEHSDDGDNSESSGYSDWMAEEGLEPPKRSNRRKTTSQLATTTDEEEDIEEEEEEEEEADSEKERRREKKREEAREKRREKQKAREGSSGSSTNKKIQKNTKVNIPQSPKPVAGPSTSIPMSKASYIKAAEAHKLNEWLSETRPRKSPYFPQMGDEIVYFMQGHQLYLDAVATKNVYETNSKDLPWTKMQIRDHEFVKVIGIHYEIKPPSLCCLKLALLDEEGRLTGKIFTVKYHDMPDVLDFFVLKQMYQVSVAREWNIGDKFRCMIDDNWWLGSILNKSAASEHHPNSTFLCYEIKWINGEIERMSPWDMEPIDDSRLPNDENSPIPVLEEELKSILYKPVPLDWPGPDVDAICRTIIRGITQVMELAIAEPFLVPVDINVYPTYATTIEYPIDLSTIKARFENRFYRRLTSAQFDIRYIAKNAEKFNERHSIIVKRARILSELCLRIVKSGVNFIDVAAIYHQLADAYDSTNSEDEGDILPSTSRTLRSLPNRALKDANDWKLEAKTLIEAMWECEDSVPFRTPVNSTKYPDYHLVIKNPMDLSTVRDNLLSNKYEIPHEFCTDMRLIFQNSRLYNTNKRSRIYVMTVRLAAIFEDHMQKIINNWAVAKRRNARKKNKKRYSDGSSEHSLSDNSDDNSQNTNEIKVESDSDSDNTPLGILRSNIHTESDSTSQSQLLLSEKIEIVVDNGSKNCDESDDNESDDNEGDNSEESYINKPSSSSNNIALNKKMKSTSPSSSDEDEYSQSDESDEDDSDKPKKSRKRHKKKKKSSSDEDEMLEDDSEDEDDELFRNNQDSISSDSDSDFSEGATKRKTSLRARPRKKVYLYNSDSESDTNIRGRKRKKVRVVSEESDSSDDNKVKRRRAQRVQNGGYFTAAVSSRGRIRKLTERAVDAMKKDKKKLI